ncbi:MULTISPECIES: hypothetical protein [Sphingobacteriaceae]|uniref:Uncharacterized protein n=1 Tax=Sphingobacterium sp. (strain 21) TaxID=743722 RepID=F4C6I6_SPHS2
MKSKSKDITSASGFRTHKSYSPEEIWAAGGTTVFGKKMGQSNKKIVDALKKTPEIEPFTDEEWKVTLSMLKENK